jgi:hypothetical protein
MSSFSTDSTNASARLPSVAVRTAVSFLIFVHFFALFAGLVFTPGVSSDLAQRFANLPALRQYRQLLDMNLPYTYQLTYGAEPDYQLEIDLELADGAREQVILPPVDLQPHARQLRYNALAYLTGLEIGNDMTESVLPQGITAGLLEQFGATRANFRCRAHNPLGRDRVLAGADPQAADTWETLYQATIWMTDDGQIRLLKQESAAESAPGAVPRGGTPSGGSPTDGSLPFELPSNSAVPPPDATRSPNRPTERPAAGDQLPLEFPPPR